MESFFKVIAKWPIFLLGSFLSNFLSAFGWLRPLLRNPAYATLLGIALVGAFVGLVLVLRAMLGLS